MFYAYCHTLSQHVYLPIGASVEWVEHGQARLREELAEAGLGVLPQDEVVYSIEGPFFFGSVDSLERALSWTRKPPRHVVLRLERVPFIDATGLKRLESTIDNLRKRGIEVLPTGATIGRASCRERVCQYA